MAAWHGIRDPGAVDAASLCRFLIRGNFTTRDRHLKFVTERLSSPHR
jgi:hypothetical protein